MPATSGIGRTPWGWTIGFSIVFVYAGWMAYLAATQFVESLHAPPKYLTVSPYARPFADLFLRSRNAASSSMAGIVVAAYAFALGMARRPNRRFLALYLCWCLLHAVWIGAAIWTDVTGRLALEEDPVELVLTLTRVFGPLLLLGSTIGVARLWFLLRRSWIAVAAVAAIVAVSVVAGREVRERLSDFGEIRRITKVGGWCAAEPAPRNLRFLQSMLPDDLLWGADAVDIGGGAVWGDDDLKCLKSLRKISRFTLKGARFTDASLDGLSNAYGIRFLELEGPKFTSRSLRRVPFVAGVASLTLKGAGFSNDGFDEVPPLDALTSLRIADTNIGDDGLARLTSEGRIQFLCVARSRVSASGLARCYPNLDLTMTHLELDADQLDRKTSALLGKSGHLRFLEIWFPGESSLMKPHLDLFDGVQGVILHGDVIDDRWIEQLSRMNLLDLDLRDATLTDRQLAMLKDCDLLRSVRFHPWRTSVEGRAALRAARPRLEIEPPN